MATYVNLNTAHIATALDRATRSFAASRKYTRPLAGALAIAALTGCSLTERAARSEAVSAPVIARGIEGQWLSIDGSSATRFTDGAFQTAALDTGKTLAEGTYAMADEVNVSITMKSLVRRKTNKVNCVLVNPGQLNCTAEDRRQFVLTRARAPVPAFQ